MPGTNHKEPGKPTKKGEALERETTNLRKIQNPNSKNNESDYSLGSRGATWYTFSAKLTP